MTTLEELKARRQKLEKETNMCLNRMDSIIEESKRVGCIAYVVACGEDFKKNNILGGYRYEES